MEENQETELRAKKPKIDVCHYDAMKGMWSRLTINENAWADHASHGDAKLIDKDGDGWVDSENGCGIPVDCDDTDATLTHECCIGIKLEIPSENPLYLATKDEVGVYTYQEAVKRCADRGKIQECDWYIPTRSEIEVYSSQIGPNIFNNYNGTFTIIDDITVSYVGHWSYGEAPDAETNIIRTGPLFWRMFRSQRPNMADIYYNQFFTADGIENSRIKLRCVRR